MECRISDKQMSIMDKLGILTDAAKYDVACTSSGTDRNGDGTGMGNAIKAGICHSFSGDGRCISLLKILFTNECIYDCKYCINRCSNDVPRLPLPRRRYAGLRLNFTEGIILKVCFELRYSVQPGLYHGAFVPDTFQAPQGI